MSNISKFFGKVFFTSGSDSCAILNALYLSIPSDYDLKSS